MSVKWVILWVKYVYVPIFILIVFIQLERANNFRYDSGAQI